MRQSAVTKYSAVAPPGGIIRSLLSLPLPLTSRAVLRARWVRFWVAPALFYFAFFSAFTYPLITVFSTHFFADEGDGLQNVWNIWWVKKAIVELHQLPWHTRYLHYPEGVSLLGHTLNPFNGFVGIPLQLFLSLTQTHNALIVFSFVFGGLSAFWLCHEITGAYLPALAGGFVFTFCNFHFAHAQGHMQLVSLEWIPLFVLAFYRLLDAPRLSRALGAALVLFLVILCDHYYFLYCVMTGVVLFIHFAVRKTRVCCLADRALLLSMGAFTAAVMITAGPLAYGLWHLNQTDPLSGIHNPVDFSLDAWAAFIPGGHWRWSELTRRYWETLPGNIHESSVHIGLSAVAIMLYGAIRRRDLGVWWTLFLVFGILALGPVLHVSGRVIPGPPLPYALFADLFPPLKLSGCPVRMMVMVGLCSGVLVAGGLQVLLSSTRIHQAAAAVLLAALTVEYVPAPIPQTRVAPPDYVEKLRAAPLGGTMDVRSGTTRMLYYQTIHQQPLAFGYISRVPRSTVIQDQGIAFLSDLDMLQDLCSCYQIRYVVDSGAGSFHDAGAHCEN